MYFQKDWFMRQIEMAIEFIIRSAFNKSDSFEHELYDISKTSQTELIHSRILTLIDENKICEAENLVFENINTQNLDSLKIALEFYRKINLMSNESLEKCNFSRDEINEGLTEIANLFGITLLNI